MIDVVHSELSRRLFEAIEISGEVGWPLDRSHVGMSVLSVPKDPFHWKGLRRADHVNWSTIVDCEH